MDAAFQSHRQGFFHINAVQYGFGYPAGRPTEDLIRMLAPNGGLRVYEAGCGTGFATALISKRIAESGTVVAVDLSEGMLAAARQRVGSLGVHNVRFMEGDALEILKKEGPFDIVFSSWVLGYIPLQPFLTVAENALVEQGRLAFVVHKENSPREPLEIFGEIVARDPSVLQKKVSFDFPRDKNQVEQMTRSTGFQIEHLSEGEVRFRCNNPDEVLEHLLKSGAGTAYYNAIDPKRRKQLESEFLERLSSKLVSIGPERSQRLGAHKRKRYEVVHEYIACIARKWPAAMSHWSHL